MGGLTCWLLIAKVEKVQQSFLEGVLRMKQQAQRPHLDLLAVEGKFPWVGFLLFFYIPRFPLWHSDICGAEHLGM
jgi:hypothetical protein